MTLSNSKIFTLVLTKKILRLISVLPTSDNDADEFVYIKWSLALIMFILLGTFIPIIAFSMANITDFELVIGTTYLCTGFSIAIAIYLCLLIDRTKIQHFFAEIECMVNERYQLNGYNFYATHDTKIEKYTIRIVLISTVLAVPVTIIPIIEVVIAYITGNYTIDLWNFLFPSLYPFNVTTDFRMGFLTIFQACGGVLITYMLLIPQLYFLAISFYAIELINDIKANIRKMNRTTSNFTLTQNFVQLILFHRRVLTLLRAFADMMNLPVFIINGLNFTALCSLLFQIQTVLESWNIVLLHNFISSYIILQQQLFAFCYLGQIITSKLPEVGVAMYDANWYNYSIKHRCHIEMIILRSQKVYILKGNRMLPCTLENFKEMLNLTFSAYLLLLNFKN